VAESGKRAELETPCPSGRAGSKAPFSLEREKRARKRELGGAWKSCPWRYFFITI